MLHALYGLHVICFYFYTKIIQWIADHNFNDEKLTDFLKHFTNNVYYTKEDIDYESLIELYNHAEQNGDTFSLSGLTPINAGTISLVFKGTLNGKPIVIKMLRRNIKDKLHDAINLFNYIFMVFIIVSQFCDHSLHKIFSLLCCLN